MTDKQQSNKPPGTALCKSCGLCCTGHLFIWSKLRSAELDAAQSLGLNVIREPNQRGFSQPCPLWKGQCTIYDAPQYPRFCHTYKCKLLNQLIDENIPLSESLSAVQNTKAMIDELELLLPDSPNVSFRERLVTGMTQEGADLEFRLKADALLDIFDTRFGVNDFLNDSEK